ncbi:MAG: hypothetical protein KAY37_02385 [Phycisphaerae bacterium]|nr:hypothetical protein [Phycisphaerae bacterium]
MADEPESVELLKTDSRAPYVHRLTLYDHDGVAISPDDEPAKPYSPRATCGKCHPYAIIAGGWHFNANDPNVLPGQPGEPWILVDEQTGTVLPLSGRQWPGTRTPESIGLTNWEFVKRFGRHIPGGGFGEPSDDVVNALPESLRWGISGKLEIDCMFCHSVNQQHDPAEAARQIEKENFKWAPTAALGLAVVRGEAGKVPDDWDPDLPPSPDYPEQAGPTLVYNRHRFDPDDRVLFNITRRPPNERCYFCHTVREVGPNAPESWQTDQDMHLAAGLLCVDCHRHGLDHAITRGYDGEADPNMQPAHAALTCRGCHLGETDAATVTAALGGRLRAPHPQHRGLPPRHYEKLTCTTCHSGPWPEMNAKRFQTSLAHGLGLASRERTDETLPMIVAPVFIRQAEGVIAPHRLVEPLSEGFEPYAWPLAHDVRPAAQALGARDCTDCHALDSPINFGWATVADDPSGQPPTDRLMLFLRGDDELLARTWAWGFVLRPVFKWFGFICAGVIALVLIRHAPIVAPGAVTASSLNEVSNRVPDTSATRPRITRIVYWTSIVSVVILTLTGWGAGWAWGELTGWPLLIHMSMAPLFIIGLTGSALIWQHRYPFASPAAEVGSPSFELKLLFWIVMLLGFLTMLSMLAAMVPVFGYAGQEALIELHGIAALLLVIALLALAIVSLAAKRMIRSG